MGISFLTTFEKWSAGDTLLRRNFCHHGPGVINELVVYRGLDRSLRLRDHFDFFPFLRLDQFHAPAWWSVDRYVLPASPDYTDTPRLNVTSTEGYISLWIQYSRTLLTFPVCLQYYAYARELIMRHTYFCDQSLTIPILIR